MGMFSTYFDANGTDREAGRPQSGAPILVVAGYLAHLDEWKHFENEWNLILDGKRLRSFDILEFVNGKGAYAEWEQTERQEFIQSLLAVVKRWAGVLVAFGIELDDQPDRRQIDRAHTLCGLACIATVSDWANACGYTQKIDQVFAIERGESGGDIWMPAITAFRYPEDSVAYGISPPIGQLRCDTPPLQAAAILARQTRCWRDARRDDPNLTPGLRDLHKTRGFSLMLNRELLNWPEEVIRIADLEKSPLWGFARPSPPHVTVKLGKESYTMRIPALLGLMFAEGREPKA
jgi:hypothetical protein